MQIEKELIKLVNKAMKKKEIPVAAVITLNNKIIAKAYNKKNKTNKVINHAEIIAICKASKKLKRWNLSDCILYSTLKPCKMCEEIIKQSYIKKTYYILNNDKEINYNYNCEQMFVKKQSEFEKKLKEFFITLR